MRGAIVAQDRHTAMKALAPRPTSLYGCNFRSQLEARWAVFFTYAGIPWVYEPHLLTLPDGRGYLPDFLLWDSIWCEVKPFLAPSDKAQALALSEPDRTVLLLDGPPAYHMYQVLGVRLHWAAFAPAAGCMHFGPPLESIWDRPFWMGCSDPEGICRLYAKAHGCAEIADFQRGKAYISRSFLKLFQ